MLSATFLTDLDSRAAVKGSRDPLGIQSIWTRFGRSVVGNLTTVSNSLRDFTTLLLGYHFAEQLADELGPGSELTTFLKWEQLAAYARAAKGDWAFRGTERVRKALSDNKRVTISADPAYQILGNQKIYGLWGLYTMPARSSGLVEGDPPRLTPVAQEFVARVYLPELTKGAGRECTKITRLLGSRTSRLDVNGADQGLLEAIAGVLKQRVLQAEREFYARHLVDGGPKDGTSGKQPQLAELLVATLNRQDFQWTPHELRSLSKEAQAHTPPWTGLAEQLDRIRVNEAVMAPCAALFIHLLGMDDQKIDQAIERMEHAWGKGVSTVDRDAFAALRSELSDGDADSGARWVAVADSLASGKYGDAIELLIAQNAAVMAARGGAPWLELRAGRLNARFREEQGNLPSRAALPSLWRHSYFLDSLRTITAALAKGR
ncbi:MAG: hypothetical protein R3B13_15380 [Polyangiaceae bacterium]